MEQKNINSTIQYAFLLVSFLGLVISLVYIHNFLNMVISQNDIIISLLKNIKDAPTTSLPIIVENSVPNTVPNTADNTIYYVVGAIASLVFIGVVCYFLFNSKPSGSSTPPTPSDGVNENSEKFTKIDLDLQNISQEREEILNKLNDMSNISQEREEILNKLNDMSEKSNGIGSIETKIEELYDYLTDPASTAENVKITEKINTLIDQQAVINAGMKQVMSSNLGFIEGTKRVFGELTTDRHVLSTTLKELSKKQTQLEINQHDLSKTQNDLEIARGIMENEVDLHRENIEVLNDSVQNCSDQMLSIKQSCAEIIKLIGEHSS